MWHKDLLGLLADDHPQYPLLLGRAGGQVLIGGLAASEHLTLQSTAHATRGRVRLQDSLQLLDNTVRDSGDNVRVLLSAASPHVKLSSEVQVTDRLSLGPVPSANIGFKCRPPLMGTGSFTALDLTPTMMLTGGIGSLRALMGQGIGVVMAGALSGDVAGLYFTALGSGAGTIQHLYAVWARTGLQSYTGPPPVLYGGRFRSPMFAFSTYPSSCYGLYVDDQGVYPSGTHNAVGLRILDQTATLGNKYLLELGPSNPYLRLVGGAAPGVGVSNLWVNFAGVLKQIREDAVNTAGAGFRRLRVVN